MDGEVFSSLPLDMQGVILGFCEIHDLPAVAKVCHQWQRITMMPWVVDLMMQETVKSSKSDSGLGCAYRYFPRTFPAISYYI
jgi:hypothetical protein